MYLLITPECEPILFVNPSNGKVLPNFLITRLLKLKITEKFSAKFQAPTKFKLVN